MAVLVVAFGPGPVAAQTDEAPVPGATAEAPAPGKLELTVLPGEVTPGSGDVTVLVSNSGKAPLTEVILKLGRPDGVAAGIEPSSFEELLPGSSAIAILTIEGPAQSQEGSVVIRGTAFSGPPVAAVASVKLLAAQPQISLTLVGNTRVTEASPADLTAVIGNLTDAEIEVTLTGHAGIHSVAFAEPSGDDYAAGPAVVTLPPHATVPVPVEVEAGGLLRRGKVGVAVTAAATAGEGPARVVTVTRELDVELAAVSLFPEAFGVGGAVLLPGVAALLVWLYCIRKDQLKLGADVPPATRQLSDNKGLILLAAPISIMAAYVHAHLFDVDIIDTPNLTHITVVGAEAAVVVFLVARVAVWWHRQSVPLVTSESSVLDVLTAAGAASEDNRRAAFETADKKVGLLVHRDRGLIVLAPQISYEFPGDVRDGLKGQGLAGAAAEARAATPEDPFDGKFVSRARYIDAPVAVATATRIGSEDLLIYPHPDVSEVPPAEQKAEAK